MVDSLGQRSETTVSEVGPRCDAAMNLAESCELTQIMTVSEVLLDINGSIARRYGLGWMEVETGGFRLLFPAKSLSEEASPSQCYTHTRGPTRDEERTLRGAVKLAAEGRSALLRIAETVSFDYNIPEGPSPPPSPSANGD